MIAECSTSRSRLTIPITDHMSNNSVVNDLCVLHASNDSGENCISSKTKTMTRSSLTDLLRVQTSTTEYEELLVHHNEDKLNCELPKECQHSVADLAMDESATKCILLLQTHLRRLPLPIADYRTDLCLVLHWSIHIIQTMIDFTSLESRRWLHATYKLVRLIQMITEG